jgi:nucleoside 2-deoxyribosyltransferase
VRDPVYLAGAIFGCSDEEAMNWRGLASRLLRGQVMDPMRRDYRGQEAGNEAAIVHGDIRDILACRAVLVNAERPSWGTAMELVYAHQMQKPIVAFVGSAAVSPWLRFHASVVVPTLAEAVAWLETTA